MKVFNRILNGIAISLLIYFTIALGLIFSQYPAQLSGKAGLDFSSQSTSDAADVALAVPMNISNGSPMMVRDYPSAASNAPILILLHGSGWHGAQFDRLARKLAQFAYVLVPDLRGHGVSPERRGDVDYIGQLEDDLAQLISFVRRPDRPVILAGHSSGGGLVVRFAGGAHGDLIDGAILMAPFLKYNAPTTRPNSGGWAQPLTRRIIGLSMLNALNITRLNSLPVIQFNFPTSVLTGPLGNTATPSYSFRLNTSFAPRSDYLKDIAALPPFLVIAGRKDESFFADQYEPVMSAVTDKGRYVLLDDVGHLAVVFVAATSDEMVKFINQINGLEN